MATFSDPSQIYGDGQATPSPDGLHYAIVTTQGIISTNQVESTIWFFDAADLIHRADGVGSKVNVVPRRIASIRAQPVREASVPYAAVIRDVRWAPDSRSLYFLALDDRGVRHLEQGFPGGKSPRILSPLNLDVQRYDMDRSALVYLATEPGGNGHGPKAVPGDPINPDAGAITGLPIDQILFPESVAHPERIQLWVIRRGHSRRVENSNTFPAELEEPWNVLSLSPDGLRVALLTAIQKIEPSWRLFQSATGFEGRRIGAPGSQSVSPYNPFHLRQYAIVNLRSGKIEFTENAPYGISLAFQDRVAAVWSKDGRHILLGNTFLPPPANDISPPPARLRPCSVVWLDLDSRQQRCIAATRDDTQSTAANPAPLRVKEFAFSDSSGGVTLRVARPGEKQRVETYAIGEIVPHVVQPEGNLVPASNPATPIPANHLRVEIRQGLNTRPAIWATDTDTGNAREVWDPNPQLKRISFGSVSVFRWEDATGYPWTGGLVLPVGYVSGKRYPLVIQTHGFRDNRFMTDGEYPTAMAAQPLANAGIAVLQIAERADHLLSWQEALDQVEGYVAAIRQLDRIGIVDPGRVGIIGFSRTCWYVETALVRNPDLFAAATLADGIDESYMDYLLFPEHVAQESEKVHGGSPFGKTRISWITSSPDSQLDRVGSAVRIEAIRPVSVLGLWELYASLRLQDKAVDFIYIPGGQHILQRPWDRLASQQGNVDWFRFWLEGFEDPIASKRDQYRKWERLRSEVPAHSQP